MAVIKMGPMISDARGSVGGTVFSRNRSGAYARQRVTPTNPQSPAQMAARDRITQLQAHYRDTLTPAERTGWESLVALSTASNKLGDSITLTPQNAFIKVNALRLACGLTVIETAPIAPIAIDCPDLTLAVTVAAGITFTAISPVMIADDGLLIQVSPALNPTINYWKGPWANTVAKTGVQTPPVTVIATGTFAIGQRYHLRYRLVNADGKVSGFRTAVLDVAA